MGVLASIEGKLNKVLKAKFPNGGEEESIIQEMRNVFLHGLTHVFQKCEELILKQKLSILYKANLNDYNESTFDSVDKSTIEESALKAVKSLLISTGKVSNSNYFFLHFDEMQAWATTPFKREPKRHVSLSDSRKYLLVALSEALLFKGENIRFAISGINIKQGSVLRISSQVKTSTLSLPLLSEETILQLLDLFCNTEHLDRDQLRVKIGSYLAGCARSCEYFLDDIKRKFSTISAEQVTLDELEHVSIYV